MAEKRQTRASRKAAAADSDDDAPPEEVSKAVSQLHHELESSARRSHKKTKRVRGEQQQAGSTLAVSPVEEDVLPDDVLAQLVDEERDVQQQPEAPPAPEVQPGRKRQKSESKQKGPVVVTVLKAVSRIASGTASTFLKDQLHGGRFKRSADMLRPTQQQHHSHSGMVGPAAKFV